MCSVSALCNMSVTAWQIGAESIQVRSYIRGMMEEEESLWTVKRNFKKSWELSMGENRKVRTCCWDNF